MRNDDKALIADDITGHDVLDAGGFSCWLRHTRNAFMVENGMEVNCGGCDACCSSSSFIHIRPHETRTLDKIPDNLLFPAPAMPRGHVLLGYDTNGRCPMLINGRCSIYDDRPLTCRNYDCRVFTAAGISAGEGEKARITRRSLRWRFEYPTRSDREEHSAVRAAAKFIREHADCFPGGAIPDNPGQLAVVAIKAYDVFHKNPHGSNHIESRSSNVEIAKR
jgi:uncharacterized protein